MVPALSFTMDPQDVEQLTETWRTFPGAMAQALVLATDRTRRFTRNEVVRQFRGLVTLPPAYVRKGVKSRKAKPAGKGATAQVRIATSTLPLSAYEVTPEQPPALRGVPVSARPRVAYKTRQTGRVYGDTPPAGIPDAASKLFVQRMPSGHVGVFYRKKSGGIAEAYGPSLQYHAYADGFLDTVHDLTVARFKDNVADEAAKITGVKRQ